MDPKAVAKIEAAMHAFMAMMQDLDKQYYTLMKRCGVKSVPLHHV